MSRIELLLFVLVPAVIAAGIHYVVRRYAPVNKALPHHDVAGYLMAAVGVLYAVVLGFLVITVWSNFNAAQANADSEAAAVGDIVSFSRTLPEPTKGQLRHAMAEYAYEVRDREWPLLRYGRQDMTAREDLVAGLDAIAGMQTRAGASMPEAMRESSLRDAIFRNFQDLLTARRQRLIDASGSLDRTLFQAIGLGGLMLLAFVFLFGVESAFTQLTITALFAGSLGLCFGLVVEFSRPYAGILQVSPAAWNLIIQNNHLVR